MFSLKTFVRINKVSVAVSLFIIILFGIHIVKPGFIYNQEGDFRQFGLGYRNKTVLPIWIISILTAILSYLFVLYYLAYF
jgi:hypothetical protein